MCNLSLYLARGSEDSASAVSRKRSIFAYAYALYLCTRRSNTSVIALECWSTKLPRASVLCTYP